MRRLALAPCVLALVFALTACGDDSGGTGDEAAEEESDSSAEESQNEGAAGDKDEARAAAEDFLEAVRTGDGEVGCALIDEDAHASVTLTTMDQANATMEEECEPAFPTYAEGFNGADAAEVGEVEMGTDTEGEIPIATVTLEYTEEVDGETAEDFLFWLTADDEWQIRTVPFGGLSEQRGEARR
ncbi:ketosteroid isomerase-like protein [Lipingzhangella halophila]|uniref:Ketosteroid isomerase-like protein n=1 Tax=Lipingzhangella halophila TaxID=1783352 RepID=A0A7W7W4B3_9ACTN|nr:hypothetical protein [Lipingzhangella halophila]MBB4933418.1 ketosteroid isomerase-like protein [Lipingzhangella halophila]